ncbi:MAG: TetR/AcrR family transcriptional regulator [Actinomycetota bacterium]|nr:TetR/AcrR family transcriptional regulator [Actinomycetota bacterium]
MLKASAQGDRGRGRSAAVRDQIVRAAVETLKKEGFAGASARAIARTGGFNQALIFYHFGSVKDLLLAALDATSEQRMTTYQKAVGQAASLEEMIGVARRIYAQDLASGHIRVLSEMVAGGLSDPDLGAEVAARLEPWIDFAQAGLARVLSGTPLEALMPPVRDLAFAVVAFYLGADLLTELEGDRSRVERLFATASGLAPMVAPLLAREAGKT